MLVDLAIMPLGLARTAALVDVLDLIAGSGLPYRATPSGTCIEGRWDEVMPLVRACHRAVARHSPHVVTLLRIEEDGGGAGLLGRADGALAPRSSQPAGVGGADDFPGIHV